MLDPVKNFAKVGVSTTYDNDAVTIVLASGEGAKLPAPATDGAFNLVWYNFTDYPDPSDDPNVEIIRVTARTTDTLTVTRAQEGTTASTKSEAGKTYKMLLGLTKKSADEVTHAAVVLTDHAIVRGEGGAKGVQTSLVTIDDNGNIVSLGYKFEVRPASGIAEIIANSSVGNLSIFRMNVNDNDEWHFEAKDDYWRVVESGVDYWLYAHKGGNIEIVKNLSIGNGSSPTARLHLPAGTASAGTAPLKLTVGVVNTTPESGGLEFDGSDLFFTI